MAQSRSLKTELLYDPETGEFYRKLSPRTSGNGYRRVKFQGRDHLAHRVAWFLASGEWPKGHIDHINGDRSDNRISNLRVATPSQSAMNRKGIRPLKGAYKNKGRTWYSSIFVRGERKYLGNFKTEEEAHAAYRRGAEIFHGEFANVK